MRGAGRGAAADVGKRAAAHRHILKTFGIDGLEGLGEMAISRNVVSRPGLLRPDTGLFAPGGGQRPAWTLRRTDSARAAGAPQLLRRSLDFRNLAPKAFDPGLKLASRRASAVRAAGDVFLEDAYWVAETIRIEDGTTILFDGAHQYLTLICRELVVGEDVVFAWQAPELEPNHPSRAAPSGGDGRNGLSHSGHDAQGRGHDGEDGYPATKTGADGPDGADAPSLDIWTMAMNRWPHLALDGQDGFPGGPGCDGGDGGDGGQGADGALVALPPFFTNPGDGGHGGRGGRASGGGVGGGGGHGGRVEVLAPEAVVASLSRSVAYVSTSGGRPGAAGDDGRPGRAGRGGAGGRWLNIDAPSDRFLGVKLAGEDGANGLADTRLIPRSPRPPTPVAGGDFGPDAMRLTVIGETEFIEKWSAPRIARADPQRARVHERVRLTGENFAPTDRLFLRPRDAGPTAPFVEANVTSRRGGAEFDFEVPDLAGGEVELELRPANGPAARMGILVLPQILRVEPEGRLTPGARATIVGTGFAGRSRVYLGGSNADTAPRVIDPHRIEFTAHRGVGPVREAEKNGEVRDLLVDQGLPASQSNRMQVTLDTFRIVVLGDSVLWGQGLVEDQAAPSKIHERVADGLGKRFRDRGNPIGIHVTNHAHSGATIGLDSNGRQVTNDASAINPSGVPDRSAGRPQEVNTSFPTILDQAEREFEGPSDTVDLVLLDGGINDVNVRKILPSVDDSALRRQIHLHCGDHMETLLVRVARKFPRAVIVVTGYYPIISNATDLNKLVLYTAGLGIDAVISATLSASYFMSLNPVAGVATALAALSTDKLVRAWLAHNCRIFYEESEKATARAIDRVNARLFPEGRAAARRIYLAAPEFEDGDAVFAPHAKLFGLDPLGAPTDDPTVRDARRLACEAYYPQTSSDPANTGLQTCLRASAGHPNPTGATLFASEILATLDMNGVFAPARFRPDFLWGAATSSFQVEGGITNNDWHHFTDPNSGTKARVETLGKAAELDISLQPAGDAAGHKDIRKVEEELDRMKALGMNAYRFSFEWARIEPVEGAREGDRDVDRALRYYDAVIDAIRARQMEPVVTLNHVTLPEWILHPPGLPAPLGLDLDPVFIASKRGWESDDSVKAFVDYARRMARRYADRVNIWLTINEPVATTIGVGYVGGLWSPGFVMDGARAKRVYFNLLKAHAGAYDAIKDEYGQVGRDCKISFAHHMMASKLPYPEASLAALDNYSAEDIAKVRRQFDYYFTWHFLDSLLQPQINTSLDVNDSARTDAAQFFGAPFRPRLDFLGVNYYRAATLRDGLAGQAAAAGLTAAGAGYMAGTFVQNLAKSSDHHQLTNDLNWEIYPLGLYALIHAASIRYENRMPVMVTENGTAEAEDHNRAAHLVAHVQQLYRAAAEGVRILGYMHWSIVDNYEWFEGYNPSARFGLFTADLRQTRPNQRARHITEGALAMQYLIAENGVGRAVERFGLFHPKGYAVSPPLMSPGLAFTGRFDASVVTGPFALYVTRRSDGSDTGMIFLEDPGMWFALSNVVAREASLDFDFSLPGAALRCKSEVQDRGLLLTGRLSSSTTAERAPDVDVRWQATRPVLFGNWAGAAGSGILAQFRRLEGDADPWRGKLWQESAGSWMPALGLRLPAAADRVDFSAGAAVGAFQLTSGGGLAGSLSSPGQPPRQVDLTRLSSGIS